MDLLARMNRYRRPLFIAAIVFGLGIVLGRFVHLQMWYIIAAAAFSLAAVVLRVKRILTLVCAAALFAGAFASAVQFDLDYELEADDAVVWGRVYREAYLTDTGSAVMYLDGASVDGQSCGNIKLYCSDAETLPKPGDMICARAEVVEPSGVRNPGGFNQKLYLLSQGVQYKAYSDDYSITCTRGGFAVWAAEARAFLSYTIDNVFDNDAAPLAKAMLLGDKAALDEQTYSDFKDTGIAHVLAVSGLHAGILIGAVYILLRLLRVGRTPRLIITIAFIAGYAFVTGLTPSILRASVMAAALLLGQYFGRQTDTLNFLSLAFIVSLLFNPADMFSAGFALSFGAVFGILTIGWQLKHWLDRRLPEGLRPIGGLLAVSVGASVGTMPILAMSFHRISTFSVLWNVFLVPFASLAIVLVFITVLLGAVFVPLAVPLAWLASLVLRFITGVASAIADVPFAAVDVAAPPWYAVLAVFVLLFIVSKYCLTEKKCKVWLSAALVVVVGVAMLLSTQSGMYIVFLDVGQGDCAFVRTVQGGEYFIDGGREYSADEVVDFTIRSGITPDAAFVSHSDADHISGIIALADAGLVDKVYCSYQEYDNVSTMIEDVEIVPLTAGDTVMLDEYTSALVLYPYKDTEAEAKNDASLVLLIEYRNRRMLFTGDISGETETLLLSVLDVVDIYKAAHHGSKFSSYALPLEALSPTYSVVSAGRNTFGHPHEWAMRNLIEYSAQVFVTKDDYAVEFYIGDTITASTYGEGNE